MLSPLECLLEDASVAEAVLNELACRNCCGSGGTANAAARVLCMECCFRSERMLPNIGAPLSSDKSFVELMLASESTRCLSFRTAFVKACRED